MQNSSYCIFNNKYDKQEYKNEIEKLLNDKNIVEKVNKFYLDNINKCVYNYM